MKWWKTRKSVTPAPTRHSASPITATWSRVGGYEEVDLDTACSCASRVCAIRLVGQLKHLVTKTVAHPNEAETSVHHHVVVRCQWTEEGHARSQRRNR